MAVSISALFPGICHSAQLTGQINSIVAPDHRPCAFVSIVGIPSADPTVNPSWPWVAIKQSQNGFREIYALLLSAKFSGTPVVIATTGVAVPECDGYVGLSGAYLTYTADVWLFPMRIRRSTH
jgi:hypothetical protein